MNHSFTKEELIRYSHQLNLPTIGLIGQQKLKQARVLCVGAGGLGSPLLLYLAAAGVGTLGIVEPDEVELSNLQRQILFQHQHIGQHKSEAAKKNLSALNPYIKIETYNETLDPKNICRIFSEYDIIADCSDNFATRYLINDTCYELDKPYVFASVAQFSGQCSTFLVKKGPCFRCIFPAMPDKQFFPDCRDGGVAGVVCGLFGTLQASEIIKWILQLDDLLVGRLFCMDLLRMKSQELGLSINSMCLLHGSHSCHPERSEGSFSYDLKRSFALKACSG